MIHNLIMGLNSLVVDYLSNLFFGLFQGQGFLFFSVFSLLFLPLEL
jgi:hypothetical protein